MNEGIRVSEVNGVYLARSDFCNRQDYGVFAWNLVRLLHTQPPILAWGVERSGNTRHAFLTFLTKVFHLKKENNKFK